MTPPKTELNIEAELKNLSDARTILARAYGNTIGADLPHTKVWHAIEYIDRQTNPLYRELLADPQLEGAA